MKIAIAGGSGFVGRELIRQLSDEHFLYILTRNPDRFQNKQNVTYIGWLQEGTAPEDYLRDIDAFINLAGTSLNSGRWTQPRKREIVESRLEAAKEMNRILSQLDEKISVVINASAIGFYGTSEEQVFDESSESSGDDFLAKTVKLWEAEASKSRAYSRRVVLTRFGVILGKEEGALPSILLPYRLFAGGTVGNGRQWLSWIHIEDTAAAIHFCLTHPNIEGPVNLTSPSPSRMKDFGKTAGRILRRPHWLPVPSPALKAALGEKSILVLKGQKVLPKKLLDAQFPFRYPDLDSALKNLLKKEV
ncbi:TIGR01777 family oxidoreductase [Bacillus massiliglaciei]|uniref:TIGR01777 family oxidoreductase n=1 Tax=Bacillus massiliglaciei TaxID=1816693 RepID=UPI000A9D718D|nr:TIGR01777 family oxidoreductase [Bacillus massiliglaciei]